jgi:hypothetical protein
MTPHDLTEDEEQKFSNKLEFFLRSTGRLFPVTPAQVEAFEEYIASHPNPAPLPEFKYSAEEILERGYIEYVPKAQQPKIEYPIDIPNMKMAARNSKGLSPEILRKMEEDQDGGNSE